MRDSLLPIDGEGPYGLFLAEDFDDLFEYRWFKQCWKVSTPWFCFEFEFMLIALLSHRSKRGNFDRRPRCYQPPTKLCKKGFKELLKLFQGVHTISFNCILQDWTPFLLHEATAGRVSARAPRRALVWKNHVRSFAPRLRAFLVCLVLFSSHVFTSFFPPSACCVAFETAVRSKRTLLLLLSPQEARGGAWSTRGGKNRSIPRPWRRGDLATFGVCLHFFQNDLRRSLWNAPGTRPLLVLTGTRVHS